MAPSALQKKQAALVARKAFLEQELKLVRMELQLVAVKVIKESKQAAKDREQKARAKAEGKRPGLQKDPVSGGLVGWSQDGKVRFGPGHACWQCHHRARGGKGGHKHTCGKVRYAR